jgi:hypothetical protein
MEKNKNYFGKKLKKQKKLKIYKLSSIHIVDDMSDNLILYNL